jgi:hypothetical protein
MQSFVELKKEKSNSAAANEILNHECNSKWDRDKLLKAYCLVKNNPKGDIFCVLIKNYIIAGWNMKFLNIYCDFKNSNNHSNLFSNFIYFLLHFSALCNKINISGNNSVFFQLCIVRE